MITPGYRTGNYFGTLGSVEVSVFLGAQIDLDPETGTALIQDSDATFGLILQSKDRCPHGRKGYTVSLDDSYFVDEPINPRFGINRGMVLKFLDPVFTTF